MSDCVVAVDVGNSAIKLCAAKADVDDRSADLPSCSIRMDGPDWDRSAVEWVRDQLGCVRAQWRIAAVHRQAGRQLRQTLMASNPSVSVHQITRHHVPMTLKVDVPDQLGIDRLLGAHAATIRLGAPLVVVDAGSAVTVDWVNPRGEFCGGAILPGMSLQWGALASGTDALPRIDGAQSEAIRVPARNTAEAIQLGVVTGIAATIDRLAQDYADQAGVTVDSVNVVLTGGDAAVISPLLSHSHRLEPNLVCRGMLDLPRSSFLETDRGEKLE